MSTEPKPKKSAEPKPEASKEIESPALKLRCKILVNGFRAGGGVAAAGKVLNLTLTQAQADFHEQRKEIKVIGSR